MSVEAIRLENFMPFEDTGWIELGPICLLFGRNSSGKSAIIRALRLLRQSLQNPDASDTFTYIAEDGIDVGNYKAVIHRHQIERSLSFSFRCQIEDTIDKVHSSINARRKINKLKSISSEDFVPWVEIDLKYAWTNSDVQARLTSFSIMGPWKIDAGNQERCILFRAEELSTYAQFGEDDWWFWSEVLKNEHGDGSAWAGATVTMTSGFLPNLLHPPLQIINNEALDDFGLIDEVLKELRMIIMHFLNTIEYLGPIRPEPRRLYVFDPIDSYKWRKKGLGAFLDFLRSGPGEKIRGQVSSWLPKLGIGEEIFPDQERYITELATVAQLNIRQSEDFVVNIEDTGYGASQVIPIIIECLLAKKDALVIIEQPELHLHPRAQAQLADLFIEISMRMNRLIAERKATESPLPSKGELSDTRVRFLIETHSEHLLLRLQRRIAETNAQLHDAENGNAFAITAADLGVIYIEKIYGDSIAQKVKFDDNGEFDKIPEGFRNFFSDDLDELFAMNEALNKLKHREA